MAWLMLANLIPVNNLLQEAAISSQLPEITYNLRRRFGVYMWNK